MAIMDVSPFKCADVAELADALVSGTSPSNGVEVQVLSSAPTNQTFKFPVVFLGGTRTIQMIEISH